MSDKKLVVIVGANFVNKGAQLMLSVTLDIVNSLGNQVDTVVIDSFPTINKREDYYGAKVLSVPYYLNFIYSILKGMNYSIEIIKKTIRILLRRTLKRKVFSDVTQAKEALTALRQAAYIIDISGYGYNSKSKSMNYIALSFSKIASTKSIPYIYFPQSFGSFNTEDIKLNRQIRYALESAHQVFPREHLSMKNLQEITNKLNGLYWPDIALLYAEKQNNKVPKEIDISLISDSVCLVPNARLYDNYNESEIDSLYVTIIKYMLDLDVKVTVLKHSLDDMPVIEKIKDTFKNRVYVLDGDYETNTIDMIISSAKIVISGRYHGLVVSLRNNIPCIAIGWSHKYDELMAIYDLKDYNIDLSLNGFAKVVCNAITMCIENKSDLSKKLYKVNKDLVYKYPMSQLISLPNS